MVPGPIQKFTSLHHEEQYRTYDSEQCSLCPASIADPEGKFKPHDSVNDVQSEQVSNGFRRINSGMYVAPTSALMRMAFEEIVSDAANRAFSEQPYFYSVLCFDPPSNVVGEDS
jgi:hypothetical protein